jgi:hypothetical protein
MEPIGYEIRIVVLPDGTFRVMQAPLSDLAKAEVEAKPESEMTGEQAGTRPMPAKPEMPARAEQREPVYESIEDALKAALRIYRENPLGASELEAFEAGFGKPAREM